ncbi:hypothetical protein MM182_18850 [Aeromonas sp. MR19]|uniref:hypothetical protein n=1 Tax=Aeromonas sp. MR19 TaxID=2923421 RepID=UPI001F4A4C79|nr:hypothetical protein [Aeromonas sp. MR19]MCH7377414.1 hypothetical protein [Aeromonas sp. MR19]
MAFYDSMLNSAKSLTSFDSITGSIKSGVTGAIDSALAANEFDTPDYARFMRTIEKYDLARSNMFLVRFQDFRSAINFDGIVGPAGSILNDVSNATGIMGKGKALFGGITNNVNWHRAQDIAYNQLGKYVPGVKNAIGMLDPTLVRMIPGAGEFLDGLLDTNYDPNKDLAIMVKNVNLPGTSFDTQKNIYNRKPFVEVLGRSFSNLKMTFYSTPGYQEREWFLRWMRDIHDPNTNTFGFHDTYAKMIDVAVLDRRGDVRSIVHCDGCFPINVSDVQLDYESNNQIATFEVEFALSTVTQAKYKGKSGNVISNMESIYNRGKAMVSAFK